LAEEGTSRDLPRVTVTEVVMASFEARVPVAGDLVARQEVLVFPEVSGHAIRSLEAEVGERVQKGDVLANLSTSVLARQLEQADAALERTRASLAQAQSQVRTAQAQLEQADATLVRAGRLQKSGAGSTASLEDAVASQAAAEAALNSARDGGTVAEAQVREAQISRDLAALDVGNATVRAPVDGIIVARDAQQGAIVASGGTALFTILEGGLLDVDTDVIETDLGQIEVGDTAILDVAGVGHVDGTVRRVAPTVDAQTRLGTVTITPQSMDGLRQGVFSGGWIITDRREALSVPATAVISDTDGAHVLVSEDGVLEERAVSAGLVWQGQREILSGLEAGEQVLARAAGFFSDGDHVIAITANAEAGE
jgi:RND family efflux transporter MFP subunit